MKNNNICKHLGILFISILLLASCNKDETIDVTESTIEMPVNGIKVITYGSNNSTAGKVGSNSNSANSSGTTIAVFSDKTTYDNYMESLSQQAEAWDDAFLAQWGHLDDDALNAKEEELNFDSEKPLTDFENSVGLQSLRQLYLAEEQVWLNNEVLDVATDPDNKSIFAFDPEEMALVNTYGEVQIGTQIHKLLNDFEAEEVAAIVNSPSPVTAIIIEDDFYDAYDTLIEFNDGNMTIVNNNNVTVVNSDTANSCQYGKTKRQYFDTAPNRKIKAIIKVPQPKFGWNGKVKAKIKSYKKVWYGWKKWRTQIAAGADGRVYNGCGDYFDIDKQETTIKRKKKRVFKWRDPAYSSHTVENGGMTGLYYQNGVTKELILTW